MQYRNNTKQRNRFIQGLRSFKDTLPKNIKKIIKKKGHIFSETLNNWKYIVGDDLFKVCYPKSFKNSKKLGASCLNIMVKRGNEVDVEYSKKSIIDKINIFFGYNTVEKIKLIPFEGQQEKFNISKNNKTTKNKYFDKILDIKNEKIKNSLIELSKLYKKNEKNNHRNILHNT